MGLGPSTPPIVPVHHLRSPSLALNWLLLHRKLDFGIPCILKFLGKLPDLRTPGTKYSELACLQSFRLGFTAAEYLLDVGVQRSFVHLRKWSLLPCGLEGTGVLVRFH